MLLLVVLASLAAFFWWLGWSTQRETARQLARLAAMLCKQCGQPFRAAAAMAARERYFAECRALAAANPHAKFRMNGVWPVECLGCGAKTHFDSTCKQVNT